MRTPVATAPRSFVSPQLATLVSEPPSASGWIFETKYDGYRIQAVIDARHRARLFTRRGLDWTNRFPTVAAALEKRKLPPAVIDGEIIVVDRDGLSSFRLLQQHLGSGRRSEPSFVAFDLLRLEKRDLRSVPFKERRAALERLIGKRPARRDTSAAIQVSEILTGGGARLLAAACDAGLEGLIGKRLDARYESGRSKSWVKIKCQMRQEFVVVGYTMPRGTRQGIGALLLAVHEGPRDSSLRYAGAVGAGFSDAVLVALRDVLDALHTARPPFADGEAPALAPRGARWVKPRLLAEVSFTEWTHDGLLRHPVFQGMREDKAPVAITRENQSTSTVAGIAISNAARVVYPEQGITKLEVARYIEWAAERMLPHVAGRPLSFLRCPEGIAKECFFQKHIAHGLDDSVERVAIASKRGGTEEYAVVRDVEGLVALVQFGIIEIHLWGCRADAVERPDRIVFDLDPDERVPWARTVEAALLIRARLAKRKLKSWVKTTGGKGIHVAVPIERRASWDRVRAFARDFATALEADYPDDFVSSAAKSARKGKIFVDWLRNGRGATWIAPWSMRARPGATVSVPISWATLEALKGPGTDTIESLLRTRPSARDPWAGLLKARQSLPVR